ncbi:phage holin family protein [Sulfitobacter sp. 1A12157]|uniref:phage holin family protein n=1 Tax=Sulfitobacter sp. 1A12157 TaxID=3368594 RepID=UPI0037470A1B
MLSSVMQHLRGSVRRALRTAMLSAGAALFLLIGLLFLTLAAWLYLITVTTALTAALILGAVYFGIGFLLLAMAGADAEGAAPPSRPKDPATSEHDGLKNLVMAFLAGITAGQKARR